MSRRTVTGLICTSGLQFADWTADYRFFSKERFDPDVLFDAVRRGIIEHLDCDRPLVVAMDDSISRKRGSKIPGVAWRRDPMSPPFHANLVWGRRFIQISAILPADRLDGPGRAIPIDFSHTATPVKPKTKAPEQEWLEYRRERRKQSLSQQGLERLHKLRSQMNCDGRNDKPLHVVVDGSYTNGTVLKHLPKGTTLIGRIRRDARLHDLPDPRRDGTMGRTRRYGTTIITPDDIRKDSSISWKSASVFAAGKIHQMRYKAVDPLLWRPAGPDRHLRLVVIAPLAYRPSRHSKLLYRHPAFLICTDPALAPEQILKAYVSRWDIEVNIRDEKQLIGFDQAQVRCPTSARNAPALAVAAYSMLLLAAARAFGVNNLPAQLPPPKWRSSKPKPRPSTVDLLNHLRFELWGRAIHSSTFSHFAAPTAPPSKPQKLVPDLASTLFYARPGA